MGWQFPGSLRNFSPRIPQNPVCRGAIGCRLVHVSGRDGIRHQHVHAAVAQRRSSFGFRNVAPFLLSDPDWPFGCTTRRDSSPPRLPNWKRSCFWSRHVHYRLPHAGAHHLRAWPHRHPWARWFWRREPLMTRRRGASWPSSSQSFGAGLAVAIRAKMRAAHCMESLCRQSDGASWCIWAGQWIARADSPRHAGVGPDAFALAAFLTDTIGIHAVFGGFILGAAMPRGTSPGNCSARSNRSRSCSYSRCSSHLFRPQYPARPGEQSAML